MAKHDNNTVPTGNNNAKQAGLNKLTEKEKKSMIQNIVQSLVPFWLNQMVSIIDVRLLDIDMTYQRCVHATLNKLIKCFDPRLMAPLVVSIRNGHLYIVDGQHRLIAAIMNGFTSLPCILQTGLTLEEEAKIFASQTKCVSKLSVLESFKANLVWGETIDTTIKAVCDKHGLTVTNRQTGESFIMSSPAACRDIVRNPEMGKECLDWILSTFETGKWLSEQNACTSDKLKAMAHVWKEGIRDNNLDVRTDRLVQLFLSKRPTVVQGFAAVKYGKEYRRNMAELFKDIANGNYTATDIEAYHISNN